MKRDLEYKFFKEFQHDGAAIMTLNMMHFEYCGIGNSLPARPDYPDGVLAEIRERTESFNTWPWGGVENCSPLMDEIADNLMTMQSDCREMYAEELICKMQTWTWLYSLSKEKLDAVSNSVVEYSVEMYYLDWRNAFRTFAEKLAVILAKLGINILYIQKRCGITLIERLDINDLWMEFGTPQLAEYYLSKLNEPSHNDNIGKVGRPQSNEKSFVTLLIGDKNEREKTLATLHEIIDGRKGKIVGGAILACFKAGKLINIPSYNQVKGLFGKGIGNKQGFSSYTDIGYYKNNPKREIFLENMIKRFSS